jgi:lipopolysaccharide export system protein LptA
MRLLSYGTAGALAICLSSTSAVALAKPTPPSQMEISAQTTMYDGKAHTYMVKGKVRVTLPQWVVTCEEATLFASPGENAIVRAVFRGNVEAVRGTDTFRADRITYQVAERRLVAEGTTRTRLKLPAQANGPVSGP